MIEFLGLGDKIYLRMFNGVIVLIGINHTIRTNFKKGSSGYFENLSSAVLTGGLAVLLSVVCLALFLSRKSPEYIEMLAGDLLMANGSLAGHVCMAILVEGMASVIIITFILMQYWKEVPIEKADISSS